MSLVPCFTVAVPRHDAALASRGPLEFSFAFAQGQRQARDAVGVRVAVARGRTAAIVRRKAAESVRRGEMR